MNPTDTNQASEDQLEKEVRKYFYLTGYNDFVNPEVQAAVTRLRAIIRTEQKKLLAAVRERVVGADEPNTFDGFSEDLQERDSYEFIEGGNWLLNRQRAALQQLEEEL